MNERLERLFAKGITKSMQCLQILHIYASHGSECGVGHGDEVMIDRGYGGYVVWQWGSPSLCGCRPRKFSINPEDIERK